jgi:curli biogenesis system outer membrane secretion channel CsgG
VGAGKGNLRYSITVSKFENKANWQGQWELGDAWGTVMTDRLQASGKFIVLGEKDMRQEAMGEQDLVASGRTAQGDKAPKIGNMTPAQLLVKGTITHVQTTSGGAGGLNFRGINVGGAKDSTEITATIYIVDSETGQVKASKEVIGKSAKKGLNLGYSGSALGGLTGDMGGFMNDNMGKATGDAIVQAVEFLEKQLDKIPWEGKIASAKDGKIIINRGSREGVTEGMVFDVGKVEKIKDEDTGETLDTSLTKVGKIKAATVKEKVTICEAVDGGNKIEAKMSIMPAEGQ